MENQSTPTPDEAADALQSLSSDRDRLASRIHVPWALMAALGGVGAWFVSSAAATQPGENYEPPTVAWLALVAAFVIVHLIRRETGVRFRAMGSGAGWIVAGIVALNLVLFSVSLGLVSFNLHWAVAATSIAAFAVTMWMSGVAFRNAVENLRDE